MQRRRQTYLLLVFVCAVAFFYVLTRFGFQWRTQRPAVNATVLHSQQPIATSPAEPLPHASFSTPRTDHEPQSFNHRLRCIQYRAMLGDLAAPEVLALLCNRKPLDALKILTPMAEAGDEHAIATLAILGNVGSSCEARMPHPRFDKFRAGMVERARENGATSETLRRLDDHLAEEQEGPTADELEACRQSASEFKKLLPGMLEQFVGVLGRSVKTLLGESEIDGRIEYARKSLIPGNADSQLELARALFEKGTLDSQAEAMTLLREAASISLSAKTELATCLLRGCPTPAADPTEARKLLMDAALAGNSLALRILAGPARAEYVDLDPTLPAPERYAWGQFRQRLNEEGCFGSSEYTSWAISPSPPLNLLGLSPADSMTAESRAAGLLAAQLNKTRELLGCD